MGHVANSLTVFIIFAPYIIIGSLTQFHPGNSTPSQRFWTMCWLVVGQTGGLFIGAVMNRVGQHSVPNGIYSFKENFESPGPPQGLEIE